VRSTTCMRHSLDRSNVIAVSYRRRAIGADVASRLETACKWHTYVRAWKKTPSYATYTSMNDQSTRNVTLSNAHIYKVLANHLQKITFLYFFLREDILSYLTTSILINLHVKSHAGVFFFSVRVFYERTPDNPVTAKSCKPWYFLVRYFLNKI
jgi:hypothetical protein